MPTPEQATAKLSPETLAIGDKLPAKLRGHELPEAPANKRAKSLRKEIEVAINRNSAENGSDTPDFILAEFLTDALAAFDRAVTAREKWYGRDPRPSEIGIPMTSPTAPIESSNVAIADKLGATLRGIPDKVSDTDAQVIADKELRRDLDAQLQKLKALPPSRERSLSITKIQEAIMWLGMDLKRLNDTRPYPSSYDPSSTKVEPTADGLKL